MIEVKIESFGNGYSVVVRDTEDGFIVREINETKIEACGTVIHALEKIVQEEIKYLRGAV